MAAVLHVSRFELVCRRPMESFEVEAEAQHYFGSGWLLCSSLAVMEDRVAQTCRHQQSAAALEISASVAKAHEVDLAIDSKVVVQAFQAHQPFVSMAEERVVGLVSCSRCYQYSVDSNLRRSGPVVVEAALGTSSLGQPAP
jgi:hypothetical protein